MSKSRRFWRHVAIAVVSCVLVLELVYVVVWMGNDS